MDTILDLDDPFASVLGIRRGNSFAVESDFYFQEVRYLKEWPWLLEELEDNPDFRRIMTSTLVASNTEGRNARRVHIGFLLDGDKTEFAALIIDKFGSGFEEPYNSKLTVCRDLDELVVIGNRELSIGKRIRKDGGVLKFDRKEFTTRFIELKNSKLLQSHGI